MTTPPPSLKPCPFCGGEAVASDGYWFEQDWVWPSVTCKDRHCGCVKQAVKHPQSLAEAITAWNTRASDAPVENEALASLVERDEYLIRKGGYFYRPNAQGYTPSALEAGIYTLERAIRLTHPNGPDGPRGGLSYHHRSEFPELDQPSEATTITTLTAERDALRSALDLFRSFGCPVCNGDCGSANPPVNACPMRARTTLERTAQP